MPQHVARVVILIDAKEPRKGDFEIYQALQQLTRNGDIIDWMYDLPDPDAESACMRVIKPVRKNDSRVNERIIEEYDRAAALRSMEQTNG